MTTFAINQMSTLRWELDQDVHEYVKHGFSGIGLYRPKVDDFGAERTAELLSEYSLHATSLSWAGIFMGSDGGTTDLAIRDGISAIRQAATIGADTVIVLAGGLNGHIMPHAIRTLRCALEDMSVYAEESGVTLALEPVHPGCGDEWSFIRNLEAALNVVDAVKKDVVGLALDTFHVGMDSEILDWIPDVVSRLNVVQLGDTRSSPMGEMNRCLLGHGCVPNIEILQALNRYGYAGPVEVELIGEDVEMVSYDDILKSTSDFFQRNFATASNRNDFGEQA